MRESELSENFYQGAPPGSENEQSKKFLCITAQEPAWVPVAVLEALVRALVQVPCRVA